MRSSISDIDWKVEWFSKVTSSHWCSIDNQKKFLDEVAFKLNVKNPSDWGKVTTQQIHNLGGGSLLSHRYRDSLFHCLQSVYKGTAYHCTHSF